MTDCEMTTVTASTQSSPDALKMLNERKTDWKSMWISISLQFVVGVQISVYYMSMWPYISGLDESANLDFLGWVVASCSIGCTIANPIYGYWNQKTMSVKWPTVTGFLMAAVGQFWYFLLIFFDSYAKWHMVAARFITGLGIGNIAALRVYASMASTPEDRVKAISLGTGGFVLGRTLGPVFSAVFTPLGEEGWVIGSLRLNMYTVVALIMFFMCFSASVIVYFFFEESYVALIGKEEKEKEDGVIVPKFDKPAAFICIYLFMIVNIIATNVEVMSTPLTTALYNWKDSDSILYNGITLCLSCFLSVCGHISLGMTRLGRTDKRIQMLIGLFVYLLYQIFMYPWWFYSGPLDYIPEDLNTTVVGGCDRAFSWCETTTRVPLSIYLFCFIVFFGIAFPLIETPSAAINDRLSLTFFKILKKKMRTVSIPIVRVMDYASRTVIHYCDSSTEGFRWFLALLFVLFTNLPFNSLLYLYIISSKNNHKLLNTFKFYHILFQVSIGFMMVSFALFIVVLIVKMYPVLCPNFVEATIIFTSIFGLFCDYYIPVISSIMSSIILYQTVDLHIGIQKHTRVFFNYKMSTSYVFLLLATVYVACSHPGNPYNKFTFRLNTNPTACNINPFDLLTAFSSTISLFWKVWSVNQKKIRNVELRRQILIIHTSLTIILMLMNHIITISCAILFYHGKILKDYYYFPLFIVQFLLSSIFSLLYIYTIAIVLQGGD